MAGDYQQKDNSGTLFKNDRKKSANSPDYTGNALVDGVEYFVSGWVKEPKRGGNKYFSMAFTPKEGQGANNSAPSYKASDLDDFDDDIPF